MPFIGTLCHISRLCPASNGNRSTDGACTTSSQDWCRYRYLLYLESGAWATKYRHLLACGGVFLSPPITHPDFFLRALTPGVDFVELAAKDSCLDMLGAFRRLGCWLLWWPSCVS